LPISDCQFTGLATNAETATGNRQWSYHESTSFICVGYLRGAFAVGRYGPAANATAEAEANGEERAAKTKVRA